MNPAGALRAGFLAAALWCAPGGTTAQPAATPEGALAEARALAEQGAPDRGLERLDRYLAARPPRGNTADRAVLHVEAARLAIAAGNAPRALANLNAAEAALPAFRAVPQLAAQLRRELAGLHQRLGRFAHAEGLLIAAVPGLAASDPAAAAEATNALGSIQLEQLRLDEAARTFERSLALLRRLPAGPAQRDASLAALVNLAGARSENGQLDAARQAVERATAIAAGDTEAARQAAFASANLLLRQGDPLAAETALEGLAQSGGAADPVTGHALLLLATSRFERGHMPEAVQTALRALGTYGATLGATHPAYARVLQTLGSAHAELGDLAAADQYLTQAAMIYDSALGQASPQLHAAQLERGWIALQRGDIGVAEAAAQAALRSFRTVPPPDRRLEGFAAVLLAMVAERRGQNDASVAGYRWAQVQIAAARGPMSPDLGFSLVRLGRLLTRLGRYAEAAPPIEQAIAIYGRLGDSGTARFTEALTARAELRARAGDRRGALEDTRRAVAVLRGRIVSSEDALESAGELQRRGVRDLFGAQARMLIELSNDGLASLEEAFQASQDALTTRAGDALSRAASRRAAGNDRLAALLRQREAAHEAWRQTNALIRGLANRAARSPDAQGELDRLQGRRDALRAEILAQDESLRRDFAGYAAFLEQRAVDLPAVKAALRPGEALVFPVFFPDYALVWTVTPDGQRVAILETSRASLMTAARSLQRAVDLNQPPVDFPAAAARELYDAIFRVALGEGDGSGIEELVVVPDGPFQSLPPQLLLTGAGEWLVERFAVTITPSVASFVVARRSPRASGAAQAFLGIGNPKFADYASADRARLRNAPEALRAALAGLSPLPETEDELRQMAQLFAGGGTELIVGEAANERSLAGVGVIRYRTIVFATHALMAGTLLQEPAIVLTPSGEEAPLEGLLTASEVAALELDADLVILSACDTGAPEAGPFADALSGLARAFMQAGARQLLVSHWAVDSRATVRLTTGFVEALRHAPGRSPARALQASILSILRDDRSGLRHPAYWAPFVIVGS